MVVGVRNLTKTVSKECREKVLSKGQFHDKRGINDAVQLFTNSIFFFFVFLGSHLRHMEVPRLGVKLEL